MADKQAKKQVKQFLEDYKKLCEKYGMVILYDRDTNNMRPCRMLFRKKDSNEVDAEKIQKMIDAHIDHLAYE